MDRIPCIKCTPELWEYIEPYLKEWKYNTIGVIPILFDSYPYLVINATNDFGQCGNFETPNLMSYNRVLVLNVEEFLERAAKLKGFTYKRKDIMKINGVEIKPGMVITTEKREFWIVFPIKNSLAVVHYGFTCWNQIDDFIAKYDAKITSIRDMSIGVDLINGDVLWEKSEKVTISMDEIAKKFGYPLQSKFKLKNNL